MKSSTFGRGLTKKNKILGIFTLQNFISLSSNKMKLDYTKNQIWRIDAKGSLQCSVLLVCDKCSLLINI